MHRHSEKKASLFCYMQRTISRHFGAALYIYVLHIHLRYMRVRKKCGQHCTAQFKRGCHCQVCTHWLNILLETGFGDKVDMEISSRYLCLTEMLVLTLVHLCFLPSQREICGRLNRNWIGSQKCLCSWASLLGAQSGMDQAQACLKELAMQRVWSCKVQSFRDSELGSSFFTN